MARGTGKQTLLQLLAECSVSVLAYALSYAKLRAMGYSRFAKVCSFIVSFSTYSAFYYLQHYHFGTGRRPRKTNGEGATESSNRSNEPGTGTRAGSVSTSGDKQCIAPPKHTADEQRENKKDKTAAIPNNQGDDLEGVPEPFQRILESRIKMLKESATSKDGENGWKFNFSSKGVDCFVAEFEGLTAGKGVGVVHFPLNAVFGILKECGDPDDLEKKCYRKDPDMKTLQLLKTFNPQTWSAYLEYKSQYFVAGRDFVNINHWRREASGKVFFVGGAVESAEMPKRSGLVRGELVIGGWLMEAVDGGKATKLTYVVQLDLKGSIPTWISGEIMKRQPMQIDKIRNFLNEKVKQYGPSVFDNYHTYILGPTEGSQDAAVAKVVGDAAPVGTNPSAEPGRKSNDGRAASHFSQETKASAPVTKRSWQKDHLHTGCQECGKFFDVFNRRHHCRFCGRILCNSCSKYTKFGKRSCHPCSAEARQAVPNP
jgi:hypothetical protein